jgi:hypothetical protein
LITIVDTTARREERLILRRTYVELVLDKLIDVKLKVRVYNSSGRKEYLNLIHRTTELQTFSYMYDEQTTLFPFNSDEEITSLSMTRTSKQSNNLMFLGKASGRKLSCNKDSNRTTVVMEGMAKAKSRVATKAMEGANKRDSETISTSLDSRAHVNRKARVETRANVVSPQGKEKTPTNEEEAMVESGKEEETGATVSLEDEAGKVKETEIEVRKKENNEEKKKNKKTARKRKRNKKRKLLGWTSTR